MSSTTIITVLLPQIPLMIRTQKYAAFVTTFGVFLSKVMMFGLVNAPFYVCNLIAMILDGLESFALPYIDDITVFSLTWDI